MSTSTEISIIEQAKEVLPNATAVIAKNQSYLTVYTKSADKILTTAKAEIAKDGKLSPETDLALNNWQVSAKLAMSAMEDGRKPITQMLTKIAKQFTSTEADFKAKYDEVQGPRNASAQKIAADQKAADKLVADKLAKAQELIELNARIEQELRTVYAAALNEDKLFLSATLNGLTLDNIDAAKDTFEGIVPEWKMERWSLSFNPTNAKHHTFEEVDLLATTMKTAKFQAVCNHYEASMDLAKTEIIAQIPAKKLQLENFAKASLADQAKITAANEAKALQEKADQELEAAQEVASIAESVAVNKEIAAEQVIHNHTVSILAGSGTKQAPTLKSYKITVNNAIGWKEIANFWFLNAAATESLEGFEKKTLAQMRMFCEKAANKGTLITSDNMEYVEDVKAVASSKLRVA